jgi:hypothetical protein
MRRKSAVALALAVAALALAATEPAQAWHREPAGWDKVRTVRHYGYYPRYNHVYKVHYVTDPYAYQYVPRRYYPYYNSGYWRPAHLVARRRALALPPYYKAWGYPKAYSYERRDRHW